MRFPRNKQIFRGQPDLASYLGVLFLLVIFLLLSSAIVFTPGVPIHLPDADDMPGIAGDTLTVAIDASGNFYYDNQLTTEQELRTRLVEQVTASRHPLTLLVQGDKEMNWETLLKLATLARKVGIKDLVPATRPSASAGDAPGTIRK